MDVGNEAPEAGQDLRGALVEAFAKQKEAEVIEPVKTPPVVETKSDRTRDESGRFVAKELTDAAPVQAKEKAPSEKPASPEVKPETKATEPAKEVPRAPAPPNGWSAEAKAKWHELPPEIMQAVAAREQELGRAAGKMDEERALGRDFQKIFQPYMPILQAEGATPQQAIASLLNTAYILRQGTPQQKKAAVLGVARQYGIDLTPDSNSSATPVNPELAAVQQELAQLKGMLSQQSTQSQSALDAQVKQAIDEFAADPANVYFNEVKADMAVLLSSGRAPDLKTAYDMVCWARADIRTSILAQQRAEDEQKRRDAERQRAEEARRKGISVTGAPGSTAGVGPADRDLRAELQAQFSAARGAV